MVKITSYTKREYIDYSLSELIELLKAKSIMFFGEEEKFRQKQEKNFRVK